MDLTLDNWRFFAAAARGSSRVAPPASTCEEHTSMLRRDPARRDRARSRRGTTRSTWPRGRSAPALAVGNTVVLKPSELTPLTALRLAEIAADILPPGVLNVVCGQGETPGVALVAHPDVAMVSLTGDVATGQGHRARPRPTRSSACTSSSAARRRWSCSTTPTSTALVERLAARLLQLGSGLHRAVPRARRPRGARRPGRRPRPSVGEIPFGDPTDRRHRGRPGGVGRAARAGRGHGRPRPVTPAPRCSTGGERPDGGGFFYAPSIVVGPGAGQRDRAARGVRSRRHACSASPTRTRRSRGPTASTTAWRRSVWTTRRRPGHADGRRACGSAPCGSTTTSRS